MRSSRTQSTTSTEHNFQLSPLLSAKDLIEEAPRICFRDWDADIVMAASGSSTRSCSRAMIMFIKPSSCPFSQILCSFSPPLKWFLGFEQLCSLKPENCNPGASPRKCWWKISGNCVLQSREWDSWSQTNSSSSCSWLTSCSWIQLPGSCSSTLGHPYCPSFSPCCCWPFPRWAMNSMAWTGINLHTHMWAVSCPFSPHLVQCHSHSLGTKKKFRMWEAHTKPSLGFFQQDILWGKPWDCQHSAVPFCWWL